MIYWRIDDFPATKEFDKFSLESFKKFDEVMRNHNQSYVLGCIPLHTSQKDLDWFSDNQHIEIALHGIKHDERFKNEFLEHETEKEITEKLTFWKNMWRTTKYIPPHNVIDHKTIRALIKSGFTSCFGGPETDNKIVEYSRSQGLAFEVSEFPWCYGRTDEMVQRGSLEYIYRECTQKDLWITLHWTWEYKVGLHYLDSYLRELIPAFKAATK